MSDFTRYPVRTLFAGTEQNPNMRCRLTVSPRFTANLAPNSPLHPATAAYAVYKLIGEEAELQDWLVPLSYGLRLAKGRGRRPHSFWLQIAPTLFGLPADGPRVYARLSVDADGVTVERVEVLPRREAPPFRVAATVLMADGPTLLTLYDGRLC